MIGSASIFAALLWLTWPMGNHGLWLAFTAFLALRGLFQALLLPRLTDKIGEDPDLVSAR
jgi:MATE family multidrug resistance protein